MMPFPGKTIASWQSTVLLSQKTFLSLSLSGTEKADSQGQSSTAMEHSKNADGGTLFLDEIGECDPSMQAKLLRVLQPPDGDPCHRVFNRVRDPEEATSNVRIIAGTNRDLNAAKAHGSN